MLISDYGLGIKINHKLCFSLFLSVKTNLVGLITRRTYNITSNAKKFISQNSPSLPPTNIHLNHNTNPSETDYPNIKLRSLNLPSFFRDTFYSFVHDNASLWNVQKIHYLRLSLKAELLETIKSLEISYANRTLA